MKSGILIEMPAAKLEDSGLFGKLKAFASSIE